MREGKAQGERRERKTQEGHEEEEEMTTQEKCVEAMKETNSMHKESDVSNRHMTWWKNAGGSVWMGDHTCGLREAVDESGEQP